MTPERQWGAELKRIMTARRIPVKSLAEASGVSRLAIIEYRNAKRLPRVDTASAIAEALVAPHLLDLCVQLRTIVCAECGKTFVPMQNHGRMAKYCGKLCKGAVAKRIRPAKYAADREWNARRYDTWKRRAERKQSDIEAHCRACSGTVCYVADCALRAHSPLPLVPSVDVGVARSGVIRRGPPTDAAKERTREYKREWMRRKRAAA